MATYNWSRRRHQVLVWVMKNLESLLSFFSFGLTLLIAGIVSDADLDVWFVIAMVAIVLGFGNGVMFYFMGRRRRETRRRIINEIRVMLRDRIVNTLSSISLNIEMSPDMDDRRKQRILECVGEINDLLETLSDESYQIWADGYQYEYRDGDTA